MELSSILNALSPELIITGVALLLILLHLAMRRLPGKAAGWLTVIGLVGAGIAAANQWGTNQTFLYEAFRLDGFAIAFKEMFIIGAILVVLASFEYVSELLEYQAEFYSILLSATVGMMLMVSAVDLVTIFVALELTTISFFILTAYLRGDVKSIEGGLKYLLYGGLSSALLLYGMSLAYGMTSTTQLAGIMAALAGQPLQPLLLIGIIFILAGFGFKIAVVPFHMWSPDVYEAAPTPVTAYLAVASKAAGLAVLVRLMMLSFATARAEWAALLAALAAITMIVGNVVAIPQTNIKRMLAYSSIAHAGYLLVGFVAVNTVGVTAIIFYSFLYVVSNLGAFLVAIVYGKLAGSDEIKDYAGLSRRNPLLAATMLVALLSLGSIPPLAGFVGKFSLFAAAVQQGYIWLALIGTVTSVVSVYYYLMVAKAMYIDPPASNAPLRIGGAATLAIALTVVGMLLFGVYPGPVLKLAAAAAQIF